MFAKSTASITNKQISTEFKLESFMDLAGREGIALPATTEEFRELIASDASWFIRSPEDFEELLSTPNSILAAVPQSALVEFQKSLKFKNGGLVHADYSSLVDHLTVRNFVSLWESFGLSQKLFEQDNHKTCVGWRTCDNKQWSYCGPEC